MITRIIDFFADSGKVIISPDELFYLKSQERGYGGVWSLIFYTFFLSLIIGVLTGDAVFMGIIIAVSIISVLVFNLVHTIFIYIFSRLMKAEGSFLSTFNLISYAGVIDVFTILAVAVSTLKPAVLLPILLLVVLWKMIIVITAVNNEYGLGVGKSFLSAYGIILIILAIIMGVL